MWNPETAKVTPRAKVTPNDGILTLLKLSLSILNGGSLDAITVYQNLKLMFISKMGRLEDTDKKDCSSMLVL